MTVIKDIVVNGNLIELKIDINIGTGKKHTILNCILYLQLNNIKGI